MSFNNLILLILSQNISFRSALKDQLVREGVKRVYGAAEWLHFYSLPYNALPDFILLDVADGLEEYTELRKNLMEVDFVSKVFLLIEKDFFVNYAHSTVRVTDNFIYKPVYVSDLLEKIKRSSREKDTHKHDLFFFGVKLCRKERALTTGNTDQKLFLTEKEVQIYEYLCSCFPNPTTKKDLLDKVWGINHDVTTHTAETHIYRLRKKLKQLKGSPKLATTKKGYHLIFP